MHSGIQEPGGGVARYYCSDAGENRPVSTEITGYAIHTLLYLHGLTQEPAYRDAALRAGRFLVARAWDRDLKTFPFEHSESGAPPQPLAYFFDCGIILRGLLALWQATGAREWLEGAGACGEAMARDFALPEGPHPILFLPSKQPFPRDTRWSRSPGCYQLKPAMGWCDLCEATGDERYRTHYEIVLAKALRTHASFLPGEPDQERVMDRLHAYCYFLEGLLPCAGRAECAAALAAGIARVGQHLRDIAPRFERSDVCAQLLRIRLYADRLGVAALDREAAEDEIRRIAAYQLDSQDPRVGGGFAFGRRSGRVTPHVNPVSTAFCVQALAMWRQYQDGVFQPVWQVLI